MVLTPKVPDFRFALDVREWGSDFNDSKIEILMEMEILFPKNT